MGGGLSLGGGCAWGGGLCMGRAVHMGGAHLGKCGGGQSFGNGGGNTRLTFLSPPPSASDHPTPAPAPARPTPPLSCLQDRVLDACRRLLAHAPELRGAVDFSSISLAIDDCYEVWESGFVSIPYNFTMVELQPQLRMLLGSGEGESEAAGLGGGDEVAGGVQSGRGSSVGVQAFWSRGQEGSGGVVGWQRLRARAAGLRSVHFMSARQPAASRKPRLHTHHLSMTRSFVFQR
jgi:hypothetical protein